MKLSGIQSVATFSEAMTSLYLDLLYAGRKLLMPLMQESRRQAPRAELCENWKHDDKERNEIRCEMSQ